MSHNDVEECRKRFDKAQRELEAAARALHTGSLKPKECCDVGSYEHTTPIPIRGRVQDIDLCIASIVAALNAANIVTVASCCGHGKRPASIILEDGREIFVCPNGNYEAIPEEGAVWCTMCGSAKKRTGPIIPKGKGFIERANAL